MTMPRSFSDFKRLLSPDSTAPHVPASGPGGMDRVIARKSRWPRYAALATVAILICGGAFWALRGAGGNVYRVPVNRLTIGTVSQGPFEDYIAVRGAVAPFIIDYLTTDQGGTVKQVLVEDGAAVKSGQPLIILSNPALQLQVAAQQLTFEQTRFKYEQDLLDVQHQISKLQSDLARDKILLDGNAIAPSTYTQEQEEYTYNVKRRAEIIASRDIEQQVRATQLMSQNQPAGSASIANAGVEALTIRAPMDG